MWTDGDSVTALTQRIASLRLSVCKRSTEHIDVIHRAVTEAPKRRKIWVNIQPPGSPDTTHCDSRCGTYR